MHDDVLGLANCIAGGKHLVSVESKTVFVKECYSAEVFGQKGIYASGGMSHPVIIGTGIKLIFYFVPFVTPIYCLRERSWLLDHKWNRMDGISNEP